MGDLKVRVKDTNVETTFVRGTGVEYYEQNYYVEADVTLTVTEGQKLEIKVYDEDSDLVYVGQIFVTDQEAFTFNNAEWDAYTQRTTDNEYTEPQ